MRISTSLFFITALLFSSLGAHAESRKHILAVFYEGCEKTCQGFQDAIAKSGFAVDVNVLDLKQDKTKIKPAIQLARDSKPDLVLVYGTTATLGVIGTLGDKDNPDFLNDVPVVFTAVADPIGSKLITSFADSGRKNVTGTYNRVPEALNIQVIKKYDPSFKRLGLIYNSNEKNSLLKMNELTELAPTLDFELVAVELDPESIDAPRPEMITLRLKELHDKGIKWLYLGSSSFLNSNGKLFAESAIDNGIAIVSPYPALVKEHPALLSIAAPREEVGALAAQQALSILRDGAKPGDLPILQATHFTYVVNVEVSKKLQLQTPESFNNKDTEFVQDFFLPAKQ